MSELSLFLKKAFFVVALVGLLAFAGQWFNLNWGRLEMGQPSTISVTGQAKDVQANQIATFTASVTTDNVDRDVAVNTVNTQVAALVDSLKKFGIPAADLKTDALSVYEYTQPPKEVMPMVAPAYYPAPTQTPVPAGEKMWQATNSVTITLRDLTQATALATLLTNANAVNVSGPNFTTDDTTNLDRTLLQKAMQDAREKADLLLAGTGQKVLRVVNVYENDYPTPYYREGVATTISADQTTAPVEPGSQTLSRSVTVVFEISR